MSQSLWSYFVVLMGLVSLSAVAYLSGFATNAELDYYAVKEVQTAAMMDSIDFKAFRETGAFKINKQTFVEQFMKRFSKAAGVGRKYKVTFTHIVEEPPLTTVLIESESNFSFNMTSTTTSSDLPIKNNQTGILLLNDPVTNIAVGNELTPPKVNISVIKKTCTYNTKTKKYNEDEPGVYQVKVTAEETDTPITSLKVTNNGIKQISDNYTSTFDIKATNYAGKYAIKAIASTSEVDKEVTRTVNVAADEKCVVPTERPRVYMSPLKACTNFDKAPIVTIEANCTTCVPEIHYTVTKKVGTKETSKNYSKSSNEIKINPTELMPATDKEKEATVNYQVVAYATPEGAGATYQSVEQPVGNYTLIGGKNKITFKPNSKAWTSNDVNIKVTPKFTFGQANQDNTEWNWYTNVSTSTSKYNKNIWEGYSLFSKNIGVETKTLSEEGYRQVKAKVKINGSLIGPGCMDQDFEDESGIYKIDKTAPKCTSSYVSPSGYSSGDWTNKNVTIKGTCSDSLSGCATASVSKTYKAERNELKSPGTLCDNAGNCTTCPSLRVKIDKTLPKISISCSAADTPCSYYSATQSVKGSWTIKDTSGVKTAQSSFSLYSQTSGFDRFVYSGSFSAKGSDLRGANRDETFTFSIKAQDKAGNESTTFATCPTRVSGTRSTGECIECSSHHRPSECPTQFCTKWQQEKYCYWN